MLMRAGMARIDSELKLDRMMKSIIKVRIAFGTIFTKTERFLLSHFGISSRAIEVSEFLKKKIEVAHSLISLILKF